MGMLTDAYLPPHQFLEGFVFQELLGGKQAEVEELGNPYLPQELVFL